MFCVVKFDVWMQDVDYKSKHEEKCRSGRNVVSKKTSMLRLPWTTRVTNEEVLRRARAERHIMKCIRSQLKFVEHNYHQRWRFRE